MRTKKFFFVLSFMTLLFCSAVVNTYAWDSREDSQVMDSHKLATEQGVTILRNDLGTNESQEFLDQLTILENNIQKLKEGSVYPDFDPNGYSLYQDHFYDPDTGLNFTGGAVQETAESQTRRFVSEAIALWKSGNYADASFKLGQGLHYFEDISNPHHASNTLGGPGTMHTIFETFVEDNKYNYVITSSGYTTDDTYYSDCVTQYTYVTDFISDISYQYGKKAKNMLPYVQDNSTNDDLDYCAQITYGNTQKAVAQLIYGFLHEVINNQIGTGTDTMGNIHVVISTDDSYYSGTDDYVYFGMELENGTIVEYACNAYGSDFEAGATWGYEFTINDSNFVGKDVRNVWLRKENYMWGDDWELGSFKVYIKGKEVVNEEVHQWLSGNTTYNVSVNGLYY